MIVKKCQLHVFDKTYLDLIFDMFPKHLRNRKFLSIIILYFIIFFLYNLLSSRTGVFNYVQLYSVSSLLTYFQGIFNN